MQKSRFGAALSVAAGVLVSVFAGVTFATEPDGFHASDIAFHDKEGGEHWVYVPILHVVNGVQTTESIFMFDNNYEEHDGKIVSVWYMRDYTSPDGWTIKAWSDSKPWNAVLSIKSSRNISSNEDYRWGLGPDSGGGNAPAPAANYAKGVMEDDALAPLTMDDALHDQVVAILANTNYLSGDVPIEKVSSGCGSAANVWVGFGKQEWSSR